MICPNCKRTQSQANYCGYCGYEIFLGYCTKCNQEVFDNYCSNCGTLFNTQNPFVLAKSFLENTNLIQRINQCLPEDDQAEEFIEQMIEAFDLIHVYEEKTPEEIATSMLKELGMADNKLTKEKICRFKAPEILAKIILVLAGGNYVISKAKGVKNGIILIANVPASQSIWKGTIFLMLEKLIINAKLTINARVIGQGPGVELSRNMILQLFEAIEVMDVVSVV